MKREELQERDRLQKLQADHTRWFTQEEFYRLKELSDKMFAEAGSPSLPPADATAEEMAEALYKWLSQQKYGDESLLHAAVCCDFVGMARFKTALAEQIKTSLQRQPQPTAEGAEEIRGRLHALITKHVPIDSGNFQYCVKHNIINGGLLQGICDVAYAHAALTADKIVEEKLPSKEAAQTKMLELMPRLTKDGIRGVASPAMMLDAFDEWYRARMKGGE